MSEFQFVCGDGTFVFDAALLRGAKAAKLLGSGGDKSQVPATEANNNHQSPEANGRFGQSDWAKPRYGRRIHPKEKLLANDLK